MTVTLLSGAEPSTANVDNNVRDMLPVANLEPDAAPLVQLMNKMGSKPARNPKVEWLEDELNPRITWLTASAAASATALTVAADIFKVGDVFNFTAKGFGGIVTATATNAITATLIGSATVSAASGQAASEMFIVSNANAEGSSLTEIKYTQLVTPYNYCQIIQEPFGVTGTEQATEHYSGDERDRLRRKHGIQHSRQLEQASFFGPAATIIGTNQRVCQGIKTYLTTNVTALTTMSNPQWESFLSTGFRYGSGQKVAFCSSKGIQALNGFAASNIRVVNDTASTYGVSMSRYVSGFGDVMIVHHKDWQDSTIYGGYIFLVDMDAVKARPLRPTKLDADVQAPDYDGFKDRWFTEYSIAVQHERKHGLLTGLTGANA